MTVIVPKDAAATANASYAGVPADVLRGLQNASAKTGVDFNYLLAQAKIESGLNPTAKAPTSSARGLFQFIESTWLREFKDHGLQHGADPKLVASVNQNSDGSVSVSDQATRKKILALRDDPQLSSALGAEYASGNKSYLEDKLNRKVGATDLYMAHFLGPAGAGKFLSAMAASPNASASALFPDAADSNPTIFYGKGGKSLSVTDVYNKFASKISDAGATAVAAVTEQASDTAHAAFALGGRVVDGIANTAQALARKFVPSLSTETVLTLASLPIPGMNNSNGLGINNTTANNLTYANVNTRETKDDKDDRNNRKTANAVDALESANQALAQAAIPPYQRSPLYQVGGIKG